MHPAAGVVADIELAGAVGDDDSVLDLALRRERAPQDTFGCDANGLGSRRAR